MNRIVACLIALAVVTGCGGRSPSTGAPSTGASPATRPTSSPVAVPPPVIPPKATKNSTAGAIAFAAYYLDVRNYALQTGDTVELSKITAPECLMCLQTPMLIESTYGAGGHIVGGLWLRTTDVFSPKFVGGETPRGNGFLEVTVHLMPMKIVALDGKVTGAYDGSNHDRGLTISTRWEHGGWVVDGIDTIGGQLL